MSAYFSSVERNGCTIIENSLILENGRYCMDFDDLSRKAAGARMLILCSPHNPVGRVWSDSELRTLAEICLNNNLIIISDEIHSDLIYNGRRHVPLASLSSDIAKRTITCIAPSKTFNTAGLYTSTVIISDAALRQKFTDSVQTLSIAKSGAGRYLSGLAGLP